MRERLEACDNLIKKYNDEEALLIAAEQFFAAEEFTKLTVITNSLDYKTSLNPLIYLRFSAMLKNNNPRLFNEVFEWFTLRPVSSEHYKFFCEISKNENFLKNPEQAKIIDLRSEVFKRNYKIAFEKFNAIKQELPLTPQIISDAGKICIRRS